MALVSALSISLLLFLAITLSTTARAATIVVNSLADPGAPGICRLAGCDYRSNSRTDVNGCKAGSGNDTINFSVSGTIQLTALAGTPPPGSAEGLGITDAQLTIKGPIAISADFRIPDGSGGIFVIASGATVRLDNLTIENGRNSILSAFFNEGTLTVDNSTISGNGPSTNDGTLTVTNSYLLW